MLAFVATLAAGAGAGAAAAPSPSFAPTTLPASQEDRDRLAAYDEALAALTEELAYIVLLGWGESPLPAVARELPATIGVQRTDVPTMVDELRFLDRQRGPEALAGLKRLGLPVPPVVESVLATNVPTDRPAGSADTISIGTGVYVQAYDQLLVPWGKLRGVVAPVDTASTASAVGGTLAKGDDAGKPSSSSASSASSSSSSPVLGMLAVAVGALVVLVAGAIVIAVSRRRRASGAGGPAGDDVLDAGRSVMAAVDLEGFLCSVAEQVRRLVSADGAVVVDGRTWVPSGRQLPGATVLDRAMTTGRSVRTDDATVVPIVAHGHVVGAMIAWSVRPQTEETLGAFAPLVGAALQGMRVRLEHEHLAFDDGLTGVGNRRRFDRDLARCMGLDSARGMPVALAMVDVDHFKRFNDAHGHQIGDAVLQHVASVISANVRNGDLVYRYGGEEFAVLLPGADLDLAVEVVERVRSAIASTRLPGEAFASVPPVTVSAGVSVTPPADGAAMVRAADGALYAAKSRGRNRVEAVVPA